MNVDAISSDPLARITPEMRRILENSDVPFDIHCHCFTFAYVPDRFLGLRMPMTKRFLKRTEHLLHRIVRRTDTDRLSSLAYFINIGRRETMNGIMQHLFRYYDNHALFGPDTIVCPLLMDLQPDRKTGVKGYVQRDYSQQMAEMEDLYASLPARILPFLAIDPRRSDVFDDLFVPAFTGRRYFGVKLYPSLGYLPSHPELLRIYEVCVKKNIPVTVHCSTAKVKSSYRLLRQIPGLRYDPTRPQKPAEMTLETKFLLREKAFAEYFNHPRNWAPVLERFPDLRLNIAHFGGDREWVKYVAGRDNTWPARIVDFLYRYPNVYTDISYNIVNRSHHRALRELLERNPRVRERTLFGSDYYMLVTHGHYRTVLADFTTSMGEQLVRTLSRTNPRRFLGI